jgi:hypothetical protein
MVEMLLVRLEEDNDGTFGVLMYEQDVFCVTLEPPDKDNQANISNIPPGRYVCKRVSSPKYGDTFEVSNIDGRTHVLFHGGNIVDHTKGCILLAQYFGKLRGDRAILNSGATFKTFKSILEGVDKFGLQIVEVKF